MIANNAKTIQIYLPTGEPRGIRIADITTRLVLAVLIPRSELAIAKQRWELDHPGIYFLFGEDEGAKPIVKPSTPSHLFYARGGGSDGKGELVEDGFVVFEGSRARIEIAPSAINALKPQRDKLVTSGVMEERDGEYVFTQDFLFPSPSTAAAVVLGRSANGWVEWKDINGQTLSDVYRAPADSNEPETNV